MKLCGLEVRRNNTRDFFPQETRTEINLSLMEISTKGLFTGSNTEIASVNNESFM